MIFDNQVEVNLPSLEFLVNALFGFLREEKLKEITEGNEEMEDEVITIIRTFVFTLYELYKLDRNLDFKKEMNI